jgi:hypothetical protein
MQAGETEAEALSERLKVTREQIWSGQVRLRQRRLI